MPAPPQFPDSLDDLSDEERHAVATVVAAAHRTFATFADRPGSDYHQAPGKTPQQTWAQITEDLTRVGVLAVAAGRHRYQSAEPRGPSSTRKRWTCSTALRRSCRTLGSRRRWVIDARSESRWRQ